LYKFQRLSFYVDSKTEALDFTESGTKLIIKRKALDIISDEEVAWLGTIFSSKTGDEVGDVTFIQHKENGVTGSIDLEGSFYEIRSLGKSGLHAVQTIDNSFQKALYKKSDTKISKAKDSKNAGNHTTHGGVMPGPVLSSQSLARCSPEYQRLLVVYTANAAQGQDIDGIISLAIQEANESYGNSDVNNLRVALAHRQQISFAETSQIENDLSDLTNNATVANLRNQHNADAVLLITDGNYGTVAGIADAVLATQSSAYAIIQVEYSGGPDYTFAHELGHLQGAQHHPDDPIDPNGPFSYGFGHRFSYKASIFVPRRYRSTIMAYPCRPFSQDPYCSRIYSGRKHFSNPNVKYRGTKTGVQGQRENWLVLTNTAANLADFRDPNELKTNVSFTGGSNNTYNFSSTTCGGQGSVSYQWKVSLNSLFNYGSTVGTGPNLTYTFPPGLHSMKLVTQSTAGQTAEDAIAVYVQEGCPPGQICPPDLLKINGEVALSEPALEGVELNPAWPNPFNPTTNIAFTLKKSENVDLSVFTLLGHKVASIVNNRLEKGNHTYVFDADALSSGIYMLRLQAGNNMQFQQITLIK
jgi:hypothetical protein